MSDQDKAEWPRHTLIEEDSHQAVSRIYVHPAGQTRPREPAQRTFGFAWFAQFRDTILVK